MLIMFSALQGCSMWFDVQCVMLKPCYLLQYLYIFQSSDLFFMYGLDLIMGLFKRERESRGRRRDSLDNKFLMEIAFSV